LEAGNLPAGIDREQFVGNEPPQPSSSFLSFLF
jgi:hypothetical protein